jgi:hypothetical protein
MGNNVREREVKSYFSVKQVKEIIKRNAYLSKLHKDTALSGTEVFVSSLLDEDLLKKASFVGNIGIKTYIPSKFRNCINHSKDIDMATKSVKDFSDKEIIRDRLTDSIKIKLGHSKIQTDVRLSPFEVYRVLMSTSIQVGTVEYREIDLFTMETGIGPIPLNNYDFKKRVFLTNFSVLPIELQIASHTNPLAYDDERVKRALFAILSNESTEIEYIEQKFLDSCERVKRIKVDREDYRLENYKSGFNKVAKKIERLWKKYSKKIEGYDINEDSLNKFIKLLYKIQTETVVV